MPPAGEIRNRKLICLAGFMGSGKTTVGQLLARQMGWHFVDLDAVIEERAGLSIPGIFEKLGEPGFRELEQEVLVRALGEAASRERPTVIALGGGTFAQPQSFAAVRSTGCAVVWLDCPIEELMARCATITNRPLFRDEKSFRQLYELRLPYYEQADLRVDGTAEPRRVVEQILAMGHFESLGLAPDTKETA